MNNFLAVFSSFRPLYCALSFMVFLWPQTVNCSTGDQLKIHTIDISGRKFHLPMPSKGLSMDVPAESNFLRSELDLNQAEFGKRQVIAKAVYDWKASTILQGVRGSMIILVATSKMPPGGRASCENAVRVAIQNGIDSRRKEHIRDYGQAGYNFFIEKKLRILNGAKALVVTESISGNDFVYRIPITDSDYLSLSFSLIPNIGTPNQLANWHNKAMVVIENIVSGLQFEGDWLQYQTCSN